MGPSTSWSARLCTESAYVSVVLVEMPREAHLLVVNDLALSYFTRDDTGLA